MFNFDPTIDERNGNNFENAKWKQKDEKKISFAFFRFHVPGAADRLFTKMA